MNLDEIVHSNGYKKFMANLYGWGAAIVIIGALFKINHFPGANIMLIIGMGTEAVIFIFSTLEPIHPIYEWERVYPELGDEHDLENPAARRSHNRASNFVENTNPLTQQLDKFLENAKIDQNTFDKLAEGLNSLTTTTQSITSITDIVGLNHSYVDQLNKMTGNINGINDIYIKQMEAANTQIEISVKMQEQMMNITNSLASTAADTQKYHDEMTVLANKVSELNDMYGKMLSAMNSGHKA